MLTSFTGLTLFLFCLGAPPAFPGEQFAYDRFVPPPPAAGQAAPSGSAVRAQEQSTRGRLGVNPEDPACPKAIINDNIPSFLLAVVVALRGQEALIPPADPQWITYPINSTSQTTFGPYYRGGDSPVWNGEQQLLDAKAVYCAGYNSSYEFAGGWTSGEWPGNRLANIPSGTMVHVVYKGTDNIILPDEPKLVGRVFGYVTGICSYQITTEAGNTDAPTNFAQAM